MEKYVQRYRDAYDLDSMSEDEAFCAVMEEILADAYAGADVFKADATEYTQTARAIAEELGATKNSEYNQNQGRAPPQGMTYEDVKNAVREVISELTGNKSGTQTQESGEKYARTDEEEYADRKEIDAVQSIGRKSINDFTSADIKATERYARQYFQEMGTKSPFFRAWFGDWRANDTTPISVAQAQGDARGQTHNDDTGWDINVSKQVFNETKSHNGIANITARPYLPYINDIIKNAVLLDSWGIGKAKSENSLLMHSLYAVADIGNGPEIIKLYVEEMNDPNSISTTKRAYQLKNIESQQLQVTGSENIPSRIMQTADIETVSDLFAAVKSKDASFTPKPVNPVLLNDDGTPRVFYHGTDSSFTEFKASEFGSREGSYFFAQNYEDAAAYTASGNVMEVYVSLENPIDYNDMPSEIYKLRDKRAQVEALKELGYDGWYADMDTGWGEVSAFYPEQIKSATDNIGTFDSGNSDIRYAIAGERSRTADLQSLEEAKRRASEGEDASSIFEETGWYQGPDGKWRYEIDDSGMEYHRGGDAAFSENHPKYARYQELLSRAIFGSLSAEEQTELRSLDEIWGREYGRLSERIDRGNGYLSDVIKHDKLFEAYPELRAVRVEFGDTREGRGQYNQSRNTIVVSEQLRNAPESTLLHEIQHAIQKTEGFAEGANPEYWEGVLKRGEQIYSKGMNEALNALIEFEANSENTPVIEAYKDLNRTELEGDPEERYDRVYQWAQDMGYGDKLTEYEDLLFDFELEKERQNSKTPRELYYNTAGEEEARDVSARRGMSAAERRRSMPGTGNRDTVFADRGERSYEIKYPEFSQRDITENVQMLADMDSVYDVDADKLQKSGKRPSELYTEFFESLGNNIYSDRFGDIALTKSSVKSEIRHGTTAEKLASIEAIPEVINSGEVIFANRKAQSDVDRIVVAAPIRIGTESYYMGVMLQRDSQNQRLYLHNVAIEKETSNTAQANLLTTGADAVNENLFITKILQDAIAVKKNINSDQKYAISPDLEDELNAVLNGSFNARNNEVVVGTTSDFLVNELGADILSNTMPARKAYAAMVSEEQAKADGRYDSKLNYHELGIDGLYNALKSAEKPIAAISDATDENGNKRFDRIVLVTDQKKGGRNIVVVNEVNTLGRVKSKEVRVNKTITAFDNASVYTAIRKAASDGRLLYLNKKEANAFQQGRRLPPAVDLRNVDFKANIDAFWANVKWKKSGAVEYYSATPGNTAMQDAFEKAFRENAENERYALSPEEQQELDNLLPEQRLWEDTANKNMHTYGYTHPELRQYYEAAARRMYLDVIGSLKGTRFGITDSEGYYTGSIGQRQQQEK